mgnify:CR=1 FL=1
MKRKNLYLMCGIPGSGKSTWCYKFLDYEDENAAYISRDKIRFSYLKDEDEYFSKEDEVFTTFVSSISDTIDTDKIENILVDATHLNEKSRNKVLKYLDLDCVNVIPVNFLVDFDLALERNNLREGRSCVPYSSLLSMYNAFRPATDQEKYSYYKILNLQIVKDGLDYYI